jgi:hypothetical protein
MNVILQHKKIINNSIHYGGRFGGGYAVSCTLGCCTFEKFNLTKFNAITSD